MAACFLAGKVDVKPGDWPEDWPVTLLLDLTRIRQLVISATLIAAEIERLQAEAVARLTEGAALPVSLDI
ncbi:hypothetical protein ACPWZ6_24885 (plasmid) [Ralstonia pseudosolanacearum]